MKNPQLVFQSKVTEKQLLNLPLFRKIQHIHGDKFFKQLLQQCRQLESIEKKNIPQLSEKMYFGYVLEGEVVAYKIGANMGTARSLVRAYRKGDSFGYEDYPLFWKESICMQMGRRTSVIAVRLHLFYRCLRQIMPINSVQLKAEFFKKILIFRGVEFEKIARLACLSRRYRVQASNYIHFEGDSFQQVLIIVSGRVELSNSVMIENHFMGDRQVLLYSEVREGVQECLYNIKALVETQLFSIPKKQLKKIIDIREKLNESYPFKPSDKKERTIPYITQSESSQANIKKEIKSKTLYTKFYQKRRSRTQKLQQEQYTSTNYLTNKASETFHSKKLSTFTSRKSPPDPSSMGKSIGEIQLQKFMQRKQHLEAKQLQKYMSSKPPQLVINPYKEFGVVKALYIGSSKFIRNQKRKLKKSRLLTQSLYH